jgi:uncharacterized protein (DUF58 family)
MTLDFDRIVSTLSRHGVAYVLVGGVAAAAHGSTLPTEDVDITPSRDRANLDRLAAALRELRARIRTEAEPEGVEFPCDGAFLAATQLMLNLTTDAGDLDLTLRPSGFPNGYDALAPRAVAVDFGDDVTVQVAALDDIIASKRAADRAKDRAALPYLEALADEIARGR